MDSSSETVKSNASVNAITNGSSNQRPKRAIKIPLRFVTDVDEIGNKRRKISSRVEKKSQNIPKNKLQSTRDSDMESRKFGISSDTIEMNIPSVLPEKRVGIPSKLHQTEEDSAKTSQIILPQFGKKLRQCGFKPRLLKRCVMSTFNPIVNQPDEESDVEIETNEKKGDSFRIQLRKQFPSKPKQRELFGSVKITKIDSKQPLHKSKMKQSQNEVKSTNRKPSMHHPQKIQSPLPQKTKVRSKLGKRSKITKEWTIQPLKRPVQSQLPGNQQPLKLILKLESTSKKRKERSKKEKGASNLTRKSRVGRAKVEEKLDEVSLEAWQGLASDTEAVDSEVQIRDELISHKIIVTPEIEGKASLGNAEGFDFGIQEKVDFGIGIPSEVSDNEENTAIEEKFAPEMPEEDEFAAATCEEEITPGMPEDITPKAIVEYVAPEIVTDEFLVPENEEIPFKSDKANADSVEKSNHLEEEVIPSEHHASEGECLSKYSMNHSESYDVNEISSEEPPENDGMKMSQGSAELQCNVEIPAENDPLEARLEGSSSLDDQEVSVRWMELSHEQKFQREECPVIPEKPLEVRGCLEKPYTDEDSEKVQDKKSFESAAAEIQPEEVSHRLNEKSKLSKDIAEILSEGAKIVENVLEISSRVQLVENPPALSNDESQQQPGVEKETPSKNSSVGDLGDKFLESPVETDLPYEGKTAENAALEDEPKIEDYVAGVVAVDEIPECQRLSPECNYSETDEAAAVVYSPQPESEETPCPSQPPFSWKKKLAIRYNKNCCPDSQEAEAESESIAATAATESLPAASESLPVASESLPAEEEIFIRRIKRWKITDKAGMNGVTFGLGDVVSKSENGTKYYAQIRRIKEEEFGRIEVGLRWLVPVPPVAGRKEPEDFHPELYVYDQTESVCDLRFLRREFPFENLPEYFSKDIPLPVTAENGYFQDTKIIRLF